MGKSSDSDSSDSSEDDRRKRDEFAERLRKKDKEKVRNIASRSGIELTKILHVLLIVQVIVIFNICC